MSCRTGEDIYAHAVRSRIDSSARMMENLYGQEKQR